MSDYERVGGGRYDIYRKKPADDAGGGVIGCLLLVFVLFALLGGCTGCSSNTEGSVRVERSTISSGDAPTLSGTAQGLLAGERSDSEQVEVVRQREYRTNRGGTIRYEYRVMRTQE